MFAYFVRLRLVRSEVTQKEFGHQLVLMIHLFWVDDAMPIFGIDHQFELLPCFLKCIGELKGVGHVDVFVNLPMN